MKIIELKEVFSTQDYIKKYISEKKEKIFVFAEKQIKGKGRGNRLFYSPVGGLYFSFYLPDIEDEKHIFLITSVSAFTFIEEKVKEFNLKPYIRIPNDIMINKKKVCGILIEKSENKFICGIGINVNTTFFPSDLKEASSLYLLTGKKFNLKKFKKDIIEKIEEISSLTYEALYKRYSENITISKKIEFLYDNQIFRGVLNEIKNDFVISVSINDKVLDFPLFEIFNFREIDE
ncbi:MAG: biotin--[acetyl-CoA-carboxylase] ligase [candidate division WOR-3 bacterium]